MHGLLADIPPDTEASSSSSSSWPIVTAILVAIAVALIVIGLVRRARAGRTMRSDDER